MKIYSFPWEEVNSSVFKNAQIYHLKKNQAKNVKIGVIVPFTFSGIYKDADFISSISKKCLKKHGIESYKKVLEYLLDNGIVYYYNKLISKLITIGLNFMGKYYYSPRLNKFYVRNGLEEKSLNDLSKNLKFKYYRCNDFFDIYENSYSNNDLSIHFQKNFQYLYDMIEDGSLYNSSLDKLSFLKKYLTINDFIYAKSPKLIIRTRNFKAKATVHNSKKDQLNSLISEILNQSKSITILNLGCPLLELDIKNSDRYFEVDHELTFSEELFLCQMADLNIMTAEAGLFTAFAACNIRIVQIDNEWSSDHLSSPIELFEARKKIGILDIDIRRELKQQNYFLASKIIIENLN